MAMIKTQFNEPTYLRISLDLLTTKQSNVRIAKLTVGLTVFSIEVGKRVILPTVDEKVEPLSSLCIFKSLFPMLMNLCFSVGEILYEH